MKLYEITSALSNLEEMSEQDASLIEYLDSVKLQLNEKVDNIVKFQRGLEASADAVEKEIERLTALKDSFHNKSKRLKEYVAYQMTKNGIEEIKTDIAKLSFRNSESLVVEDVNLIPKEFVALETTLTVDKVALKKAIHDGKEIKGAFIQTKKNLQIK